jgi:hypothetical protein
VQLVRVGAEEFGHYPRHATLDARGRGTSGRGVVRHGARWRHAENGASHRSWAAAERMRKAYPNARMVHLPVHASWLNQVEVYFFVLQRKLLTPDDFGDLDGLAEQVLAFERHYNATARPFDWRFTRTDLNQLLTRISRHDPFSPQPLAA